MPYGVIYRLEYQSFSGQTVQVNICQTSTFDPGATTVYTDLTGAKSPFKISISDSDENKFTSIRGKAAKIRLIPSGSVNAETFAEGEDNEWFVDAFVQGTNYSLFKGFLVMNIHSKPFLPVSHKNPFTLTATDQLGTLKEIELTDEDGERITGKNTILQYVLWALGKTNLELNLVITTTWFEESQTVFECPWENIYLDHKTFEKKIGEKVDCYTALQTIFGFDCCIFQRGGKWWIKHIDEPTTGPVYTFEYQADGTPVSNSSSTAYVQVIGKTEDIKFIGKDALVNYVRLYKFTKLTYPYQKPIEIVDNIDFSRGLDDLAPISVDLSLYVATYANLGAFPSTGQYDLTYKATDTGNFYRWTGLAYEQITGAEAPTGTAYVWEDWTLERVGGGAPNASAYITKVFQYGDERARYGVITTSTNGHRMVSNPVPVGRYDKFTVSVDRRLSLNRTGAGSATEFVLQVKLTGVDGSVWTVNTDGSWTTLTNQIVTVNYNINTTDEREWMNCSVDVRPAPVTGNIVIALYQSQFTTTVQTHYSNLQFNYIPFINGSYQRYNGHSHKVSQDGVLKANIDDTVYIGDSPRPLFKGAMFKLVGGQYVLTQRWYAAGDLLNQAITPPIPDAYLHSFGFLQIYSVWNQYNRQMRMLNGTIKGLRLDTSFVPDLLENYSFSTNHADVNNKKFMLVSSEQDYDSEEGTVTLIETYDTTIGKDYISPYEFKYTGGDI